MRTQPESKTETQIVSIRPLYGKKDKKKIHHAMRTLLTSVAQVSRNNM